VDGKQRPTSAPPCRPSDDKQWVARAPPEPGLPPQPPAPQPPAPPIARPSAQGRPRAGARLPACLPPQVHPAAGPPRAGPGAAQPADSRVAAAAGPLSGGGAPQGERPGARLHRPLCQAGRARHLRPGQVRWLAGCCCGCVWRRRRWWAGGGVAAGGGDAGWRGGAADCWALPLLRRGVWRPVTPGKARPAAQPAAAPGRLQAPASPGGAAPAAEAAQQQPGSPAAAAALPGPASPAGPTTPPAAERPRSASAGRRPASHGESWGESHPSPAAWAGLRPAEPCSLVWRAGWCRWGRLTDRPGPLVPPTPLQARTTR
jgi:hypothetical protein